MREASDIPPLPWGWKHLRYMEQRPVTAAPGDLTLALQRHLEEEKEARDEQVIAYHGYVTRAVAFPELTLYFQL